jgi:23S rRNA (guanosine2251-2'-O)-methyltransferase
VSKRSFRAAGGRQQGGKYGGGSDSTSLPARFGAGPARPARETGKSLRAAKEGLLHREPRRPYSRPSAPPDIDLIYGFHAVREALRSTRRKKLRLFATEAAAEKLQAEIAVSGLSPEIGSIEEIGRRLSPEAVHQGLLLEARPLAPIEIADLPPDGFVLVLDQITDPHNVGAILRTAAAFGVDALVTTERHTPAFSGIVAKSASGGLEHVGLVRIVNLARALEELGDRDYLRIGLDSNAPISFEEASLRRPLALVLGAEGKGLRRLTRDNCDLLARLDMPGKVKSLNVSNACAVALAITRLKLPR